MSTQSALALVQERLDLEAAVGWNVCGINGCILAARHPGSCIFPDIGSRKRERKKEESVSSAPPAHSPAKRAASSKPKKKAPAHATHAVGGCMSVPTHVPQPHPRAAADESVSDASSPCYFDLGEQGRVPCEVRDELGLIGQALSVPNRFW
jgi:hypothetical protein